MPDFFYIFFSFVVFVLSCVLIVWVVGISLDFWALVLLQSLLCLSFCICVLQLSVFFVCGIFSCVLLTLSCVCVRCFLVVTFHVVSLFIYFILQCERLFVLFSNLIWCLVWIYFAGLVAY
mgnify:CR=1 FL=1